MSEIFRKVLFLDLDGTVIETVSGKTFPFFIGDMKFKEGMLEAILNFVKKNRTEYIFIVTNQGGIAHRLVTASHARSKCSFVCECITDFILRSGYSDQLLVEYYLCADDKNSKYRKPDTGMLEQAVTVHIPYDMAKDKMFMVGDASGLEGQFSDSDKKTAENFGIDYMDVSEFITFYKLSD
jgi:DNA 3'-phosphatase